MERITRQQFLKVSTIAVSTILFNDNCTSTGVKTMKNPMWTNLKEAHSQYQYLAKSKESKSIGSWNISQIMQHCAQSIEFSMEGFPLNKSKVFQNTLGSTAFFVFSIRGRMNHSLSEPIPGAGVLIDSISIQDSWTKLDKALENFYKFQGDLFPHFAYGNLSKSDYEKAHTFHLANHWEEIDISG
jgi:hypothetical protein